MKIGEHIDWVTATILKHSHDSTTLPRGSESERSSDSRVVMLNESHPLQQICNRLTSVHAIFVEVGSMLGHLDVVRRLENAVLVQCCRLVSICIVMQVMAALSRKTQNLNVLVVRTSSRVCVSRPPCAALCAYGCVWIYHVRSTSIGRRSRSCSPINFRRMLFCVHDV